MIDESGEKGGARRVLVVEDDKPVAAVIARMLSGAGYVVDLAHVVDDAVAELSRSHYHAAIVDVRLHGRLGHEVIAHAAALPEPPALLMMSGVAEAGDIIAAMRSGVSDFLEKPVERSELLARLDNAVLRSLVGSKLRAYESKERRSVAPPPPSMNTGMRDALLLADRVASTPASSALLVGESGVGKEIVAARIHNGSSRAGGPFVRVNLAAIPESVLEAELFGSVRGAFTDSKANRAGYLASADGGTILLDEIGEFRLENQAKLLRVLEERKFFPVGSDRERAINVRVIAATNRDPQVMLEAGLLRLDLFYRLGTVIHIPPLRERTDEIIPLADHFLNLFCSEFGRAPCRLMPETVALLEKHPWPGNVRQLRNAIERAVILSEGDEIHPAALELPRVLDGPSKASIGAPPPAKGSGSHRLQGVRERALAHVEREQILRALASAKGSRSRAARLLGLSRSTLYERLKRYGIG